MGSWGIISTLQLHAQYCQPSQSAAGSLVLIMPLAATRQLTRNLSGTGGQFDRICDAIDFCRRHDVVVVVRDFRISNGRNVYDMTTLRLLE